MSNTYIMLGADIFVTATYAVLGACFERVVYSDADRRPAHVAFELQRLQHAAEMLGVKSPVRAQAHVDFLVDLQPAVRASWAALEHHLTARYGGLSELLDYVHAAAVDDRQRLKISEWALNAVFQLDVRGGPDPILWTRSDYRQIHRHSEWPDAVAGSSVIHYVPSIHPDVEFVSPLIAKGALPAYAAQRWTEGLR